MCLYKCLFVEFRCPVEYLDSQRKFQMPTLFFGRDIGVSMRNKNMAVPYQALELEVLDGSYQPETTAAKDKFLTPRNKRRLIFGLSYLLAPRVHFASTEG